MGAIGLMGLRAQGRSWREVREIAVLAYVDGMNQTEIAEQTGYSRQTVNKKLQQIKTHAKQLGSDDD